MRRTYGEATEARDTGNTEVFACEDSETVTLRVFVSVHADRGASIAALEAETARALAAAASDVLPLALERLERDRQQAQGAA